MFGIDDAIIGGGLSIIGGLFGGGKKETESHVDYKRLVRDAEAAGFNPLTALRNGGAAGFTHTSMPGLTSAEVLGQALGQAGSLISNYNPMADDQREVEYQIAQAQLANLQADTALKKKASIGGVPSWTGSHKKVANSGALGSLPPETQTPQRTNPWPSFLNMEVNPWSPDMQNFEDRYGDSEIGSTLFGAGQLVGDLGWNVYRALRSAAPKSERLKRSAPKSTARPPVNPLAWPAY